MQTNIFAYTASSAEYPEYVSLNIRDGKVTLDVRGPKKPPNGAVSFVMPGDTVSVVVPQDQVETLRAALNAMQV